jgi:hypothetical protein
MSVIAHYCMTCCATTRHLHMHDCPRGGRFETHIFHTERFECTACHRATFAHSPDADTFRFVLDGLDRQSVASHAMVRR